MATIRMGRISNILIIIRDSCDHHRLYFMTFQNRHPSVIQVLQWISGFYHVFTFGGLFCNILYIIYTVINWAAQLTFSSVIGPTETVTVMIHDLQLSPGGKPRRLYLITRPWTRSGPTSLLSLQELQWLVVVPFLPGWDPSTFSEATQTLQTGMPWG